MTQTMTSAGTGVWRAGAIGGAVALAAALVIYFLVRALGADLAVSTPAAPGLEPLPWPPVVAVTVGSAVAATVFAWLLDRFVPQRAATVFTVVAVVVLLLSMAPVVTTGIAAADAVALVVLHVVVAAAIIVPIRSALQRP